MPMSLKLTQRPVRHAALELRTAAKSTAELQAAIAGLRKTLEASPDVLVAAAKMAVENAETVRTLMRLLTQLSPAIAPHYGGDASKALGDLIAARDPDVAAHHRGVEAAAGRLAAQLNLDQATRTRIARSARVFDVGKLFVPADVLYGDGPLDRDTWPVVQRHAIDSFSIVKEIPSLAPLSPIVRAHHERPDGHGYPDGLRSEAIPLEAHVIAIADTWVSVVSSRPYRPALSVNEAVLMLKDGRGRQWHSELVDGLIANVAPKPRSVPRLPALSLPFR
jgi:HD-GYP domain-containing protein (c-di-GMP phosphodiesterase class II)